MGRWQPDARARLLTAALALYGERGYDETTVAEIAERAGLTKRTFFRYFADKREVLFWGAELLEQQMVAAIEAAPASASALGLIGAALDAAGDRFEEVREFAGLRHRIIASSPELRERELIKLASLASALAGALRRRGVGEPAASLTAEAGIAVFKIAFGLWIDGDSEQDLPQLIQESLDELKAVTAGK